LRFPVGGRVSGGAGCGAGRGGCIGGRGLASSVGQWRCGRGRSSAAAGQLLVRGGGGVRGVASALRALGFVAAAA